MRATAQQHGFYFCLLHPCFLSLRREVREKAFQASVGFLQAVSSSFAAAHDQVSQTPLLLFAILTTLSLPCSAASGDACQNRAAYWKV